MAESSEQSGAAARRLDAWHVLGPGGGGTMIGPTISPHDADLVVEHCDMTGAYITTDAGRSWRMFHLRGVVQAFAFDPQDPNVVYAGNMALWRSEDRGRSWRMILPDPARNTVEHTFGDHAESFFTSDDDRIEAESLRVQALAVSPADSGRLWFVTGGRDPALYTSPDRGKTWRRARELNGERPLSLLAVGRGDESAVCIVTAEAVHVGRGDRWERRSAPEGGRIQYAAVGRRGGDEVVIYALTSPEDRMEAYCPRAYVSTDGGSRWEEITEHLAEALPRPDDGSTYVFRAVGCAAEEPETAYVGFTRFSAGGGVKASGAGVVATGVVHSGIVKTADAGGTWQVVFEERRGPAENLEASWVEGRAPDESIWFDAPVSIGVAPTDGAVCYATDLFRTYRTLDGGRTWMAVNSARVGGEAWTTRGLDVTTCYGVHFDPFDVAKRVYISYTDIGLFRSEDGGRSWVGVSEGIPDNWRNTTYWIEFDPDVEGLIWGGFSGVHDLPRPKMWHHRELEGYRGGVAISRDGGRRWAVSNEGMPETAPTHVLMDPDSPVGRRTLYVCAFGRGVYKSVDNGATWRLSNSGIDGEQPFAWRIVRAPDATLYLIVARRSDDGSIGTEGDGALYRSADGAESWQKIALPDGVNGPNGLAVDPHDPRRLYLGAWGRQEYPDDVDGGVFLSDDGGASWRCVLDASRHIYDVTIGPRDPRVIYACGFDSSAYQSGDAGETWERIRGFNFKWGHRVVPDPHDERQVYITTFGGSVWRGPAAGDPHAPEDIATPMRRGTEEDG